MNATVAAADAESGGRQTLVSDSSRVLALLALATLGPPLYTLAAGLLVLVGGRQRLGPVRQRTAHLLLLHVTLAGLLFSALHGLPLAHWAGGTSSLSDAVCRLGRCVADALYGTQTLLLTAAVVFSVRRPGAYLATLTVVLLWLLGAGLNMGHVHWRVEGARPTAGDGCAQRERRAPLLSSSRRLAALPALVLLAAAPLLFCRRCRPPEPIAPLSTPLSSLRPLLGTLAAVRTASCVAQLLALQLAAGDAGLLDGAAGVLRDAGVLLEAALLVTLYPGGCARLCSVLPGGGGRDTPDPGRPEEAKPAGRKLSLQPAYGGSESA